MSLSPDRWKEARRIFEQIVEQPSSEWRPLLEELCGRSKDVREEVESLLRHYDGEPLTPPVHVASAPSAPDSAPVRVDRFDIIRTIGRGGYGNVYLAFDRERDHHVALKSLQQLDSRAIRGFKKGFRLLKEIQHPNLVKMHELVSDGQSFYLGMELLEGTDFLTHAASRPAEDVLPAFRQLASGLHALHEHGVLHRDVKPSNVWVTPTGRVVLLDFGMAREIDVPFASGSAALFGTSQYIAPELLGGATAGPACDWYAVGVMLHEWLAGEPPFQGTPFEVLVQKRERPVPTPIRNRVSTPADIVAICTELLEREPAKRPDGPSVIARLGSHGPALARAKPRQPILTGRARHLERLAACYERTRGEATVVWIRGASGSGKTTLVQHFLKRIRKSRSDLVALEGRCHASEFLPYKAVDELVDELARYLSSLSAGEVSAVLPRNADLLARIFPVMSQFSVPLPPARITSRPEDHVEVRRRAFHALRELLDRLAERKRVILFIDDAQWGDLDSVPLLTELMAPPDSPPLLWLVAYREEDTASSPFLNELLSRSSLTRLSQEELAIEPLEKHHAESLAATLFRRAGRGPHEDVVRTIAAESGGSPLFVNQLVQHWSERMDEHAETEKTVTLDEVLVFRVERLPVGPRELLELVVVAGRRLEQSVAFRAMGASAPSPDERDRLISERLLRTTLSDGADALDVYHDRVRETLLPRIPDERVAALHARVAVSLEAEGGVEPERLMHHFELGGQRQKAASYGERAAEAAALSLSFDRASELYRWLLEWGDHTPERASALRRSLASALSSAGRSYEAAREYARMAEQSPPEDRFEVERLAAEHYLRSGHVEDGIDLLRALCARTGVRFPGGTLRGLASTLWNRARVRLRGMPSRSEGEASVPTSTENQLNLCWMAGFGIGLVDAVLGSYFHSRFFLLASRAGDARRIAMALAAEAAYSAFSGERARARGERIYRHFEDVASEIDDPFVRGFGLAMRGTMSWLQGDFRPTKQFNVDALAIFEAEGVGMGWERTTAQILRIGSMSMMGEWDRIAIDLPALLEDAASRGDRYAHVGLRLMPYPYFVRLAADEPERARTEIVDALSEWTPEGFHIQHCDAMFGLTDVALYEGRGWDALEILEAKREGLRRSHLLYAQLTRIFFHTLRARSALVALAEGGGTDERRAEARVVLDRDVRRVRGETAAWCRGWSLLLIAGRCSLDDRLEDAATALASAESELERADMLAWKAACRWRRGALIQGDDGRRLQNGAEAWMGGRGVRAPERLADMFVPGRWR